MQHESDRLNWYGSQVPLVEFDQLEQFSRAQFDTMLGRGRSSSGIKPYIRATCNPDPDSWLADFLAWSID